MDREKATTWIRGQIELDSGDIVKFEFSPDREHGGGVVDTKPAEGRESLLTTHPEIFQDASGVLGAQMSKFLKNAKNMFSMVSAPKMPGMPGYAIHKPKDRDD